MVHEHWLRGEIGRFNTYGSYDMLPLSRIPMRTHLYDIYQILANHLLFFYNTVRSRMDRKLLLNGEKLRNHKWKNHCYNTSRDCRCPLVINNDVICYPLCFMSKRLVKPNRARINKHLNSYGAIPMYNHEPMNY